MSKIKVMSVRTVVVIYEYEMPDGFVGLGPDDILDQLYRMQGNDADEHFMDGNVVESHKLI